MAGCGTKRMKAGGPTGMPAKKMAMGGMAMGAGRGYKVGGKIDGCAKRGRTNCKMR